MNFGIFYIISDPTQSAKRLRDFSTIKRIGVNMVCSYFEGLANDYRFIDKCHNAKIKVVLQRGKRDIEFTKINKVIDAMGPKVYGILNYDDVDSPRLKYKVRTVRKMNKRAKVLFPGQKIYISGGYPKRLPDFKDCGQDQTLVQGYPIGNDGDAASAGLDYWVPTGRAFAPFPWAPVIQAFAWPGQRFPRKAEIRSMVYQALVYEVSEIWFYTFCDDMNRLTNNQRKALRHIIREIKMARRYWDRIAGLDDE